MSDLDKVPNQAMDDDKIISVGNQSAEDEAIDLSDVDLSEEENNIVDEDNDEENIVDDDNDNDNDDDDDEEVIEEEDDDDDDDDDIDDINEDEDQEDNSVMEKNETKKTKKTKTPKIISSNPDDILGTSLNDPQTIETTMEDYDSEEDDYEAEDYQKLDEEMRKNYLVLNHPESTSQNYDEIYKLSKVVRNKLNMVIDDAHRTLPMLTKYEKARILGVRAKQINNGSTPFIELKENIIDGYLIAEKELAEKKIPFIIRRPLPNRGSEYWRLEDLELI